MRNKVGKELYSDYIETQTKEFRHHFLSGWKLLNIFGTNKGRDAEISSQKIMWQQLNHLVG